MTPIYKNLTLTPIFQGHPAVAGIRWNPCVIESAIWRQKLYGHVS